ncbi:DNA repair protein Rad7, protein [Diplocarpon rosae]|nr:DNA repair protein Rad7, protein [Diplocarpon rosae]
MAFPLVVVQMASGIDAHQIKLDAIARRAAAAAAPLQNPDTPDALAPQAESSKRKKETKAQEAKRKKEEQKAIAKIKASKTFQRKRRQIALDSDATDEDAAARADFEQLGAPIHGQMENCEVCRKRFSVTAYTKPGPEGGLLCSKCCKDMDQEAGAARKKRKVAAGRSRRQIQSNLLDGIYPGAKSLVTLCVETLAKNIHMAESFGDLPPVLVDRLAAILSKKWLVDSTTLDLFLRPGADTVTVYDGSKLTSDDYIRIFQIVPTVKYLRLRNAVQFKNKVMDHLLGTTVELESLSLHGANLIDDDRWNRFLTQKGTHLKALKIYHTDGHFGDPQLERLITTTPQLERLKICHNQQVTDAGLSHIGSLPTLEHLSLEIYKPTTTGPYVSIVNSIGPGLRTLSLRTVHHLSDDLLVAIHTHCRSLFKLRLTDNEVFTDAGFASLFTNWRNPPLVSVDLHKCRHLDAAAPRVNVANIGLCSAGFTALMAHSGAALRSLDVHSCRHISREAFETVFAPGALYPELRELNLSFCQGVNDLVAGLVFRACPRLKTLKVFGNFGVRDVRVPKGRILIGVPNALGMQIEGTEEGDGRVI